MGAVIAGPCDGIGCPSGPRHRPRRIDALVAVDGGVGNRRQCAGMFHDATQKVPPGLRQAQIHRIIGKHIRFCRAAGTIPNRNMCMAAIAGKPFNWFWHEGGAQAVLFRH